MSAATELNEISGAMRWQRVDGCADSTGQAERLQSGGWNAQNAIARHGLFRSDVECV